MFFKELSNVMASGTDVSITIRKQGGTLTVSVFPKSSGLKDEAQQHLQPIVMKGTPDELDAGFIESVGQPVKKVTGLLSGMKDFEDSLQKVEAEKKEAQEKKKNAEKEVQERKAKFDKLITKSGEQEKEGKFTDALQTAREARTFADDQQTAKTDERINQLKAKCYQGSLF